MHERICQSRNDQPEQLEENLESATPSNHQMSNIDSVIEEQMTIEDESLKVSLANNFSQFFQNSIIRLFIFLFSTF